ncbi:MAG: hypothetical protein K2N24_09540 [Lachnospiraceae bacterium]|nr:hypothetical protein [Lachnospiraceae bacterium]
MQKLWMMLGEQSLFVYVVAGIGILGVLSKLLLQGKLHRLVKESERMASTTKRQIRTIRNHYENSLNMDLQVHNIQAFVDKHLLKLRMCGIPIRIWDGMTLEAALLAVAAGGIGVINTIHKGYGEDVVFNILFVTIISCACLLSMENIFRIENSIDRLQANIEDYLENNLKNRLGRPLVNRQNRSQRLAAVTTEVSPEVSNSSEETASTVPKGRVDRTQTASEGRAESRPLERDSRTDEDFSEEDYDDIPEYEMKAIAEREAAAGREAEVVAQVLRNFFSS